MATNLLWFVMAGFLLGFATSTLWEWFYFRKERLKLTDRRIRELEAKLRDADLETESVSSTTPNSQSPLPTVAAVTRDTTRTSAWGDTAYRSPGVFLESEEFDANASDDDSFEPKRPGRAGAASSTLPTVDNVVPKSTTSSLATQSADSSTTKSESQSPQSSVTNQQSITDTSRVAALPSPADALRAKRGNGPRSRQEVLAALRRNSEAVQRGETPELIGAEAASAGETAKEIPTEDERSGSRASSLVSPVTPVEPALNDDSNRSTGSPARQRWATDPALTARSQEYPDDLSKIKGIGDVYKQRLYRAGIHTWKQIVEADSEALRRATSAYPSSNVEEWATQAEKLMEKYGRKQAVYGGPPPDDMTKILGIGPVSAAALYRAGVCTYEDLASLPISELEALFPIAVAGDLPDFEQWVARAADLADEKHRE